MNKKPLILVVEDEAEIADILIAYLERDGYDTLYANNGVQGLDYQEKFSPSLIILDIRMPGLDGWAVLAEIRRRGETPVIMLTANDEDADKLSALRIGADDYVVKPFNPSEIVARTQAVLRRTNHAIVSNKEKTLESEFIKISPTEHSVFIKKSNEDIGYKLTTTEFKILMHLIKHPKKVFSRQELMESCLSESDALERTVDSHISKLRKKLENAGVVGVPESIRGFGYRLGK